MPSTMDRFPVSPPAHSGPRMVARPPTERLTPWLKPGRESMAADQTLFSGEHAGVFLSRA